MKKILLVILLFFVVSSAALAAYKHDTLATRFIHYSDFIEIQKDVYVSPDYSLKQRQALIKTIENAKARIAEVFGDFTATPVIISSQNPIIRKKYSSNSYAKALFFPFSDRKAYIVIGENGDNLDVIAHELVHAEVFNRVGYINQLMKIPVWFNEGIAMQVDYRDRYNRPSIRKPLNTLKSGRQFFSGTTEQLTQHYAFAKSEIKKWLHEKNDHYLFEFLEKINHGEDFNTLYNK